MPSTTLRNHLPPSLDPSVCGFWDENVLPDRVKQDSETLECQLAAKLTPLLSTNKSATRSGVISARALPVELENKNCGKRRQHLNPSHRFQRPCRLSQANPHHGPWGLLAGTLEAGRPRTARAGAGGVGWGAATAAARPAGTPWRPRTGPAPAAAGAGWGRRGPESGDGGCAGGRGWEGTRPRHGTQHKTLKNRDVKK